jgi:hypothetical protein
VPFDIIPPNDRHGRASRATPVSQGRPTRPRSGVVPAFPLEAFGLLYGIARVEDERDEARRIGTLRDNLSPGVRLYLGDTSEWRPWLMDRDEGE